MVVLTYWDAVGEDGECEEVFDELVVDVRLRRAGWCM